MKVPGRAIRKRKGDTAIYTIPAESPDWPEIQVWWDRAMGERLVVSRTNGGRLFLPPGQAYDLIDALNRVMEDI